MKYFLDGLAIRELFEPHFKIPLNPPFAPFPTGKKITKGDDDGFSPLAKGS
jgi:hypothetical protein